MPIEIRYDPSVGLIGQAAIAAASGAGGGYTGGGSTGAGFLSTLAAQFGALARAREEANLRKTLASMELQRDLMRYEYGERAAAREADLRMRLAQMGFERQRQLAELEARRQMEAQAAARQFQAQRDMWLEAMAQAREEREAQRRKAAAELEAILRERAAESSFLRDIAKTDYEDKLRARRQAEQRQAAFEDTAALERLRSQLSREEQAERDKRRYEYERVLREAALAEEQIKDQQAWEKASLEVAEDTVAGIVKQLSNENLTPEGRQLYSKLLGELRMIQSERMRLRPRQYYDALVQWIKKVDDSRLDAYRIDELPIEQQFQSSAVPAENGTGFFVKNRSGWRFFNTQPRLGATQAPGGAAASRGARPQISIDQYMRLRESVEQRLRLRNALENKPIQPTDEEVDAELQKILKHYTDLLGLQYGPAPGQTPTQPEVERTLTELLRRAADEAEGKPAPPEAAGTLEEELQRLQQVEESRRGPDAEALQRAQELEALQHAQEEAQGKPERVEVFASPEVESKLRQLLPGAADQAEGKVRPEKTAKRKLTPEQFDARQKLVAMLDRLQKDIDEKRDPFPDEQTRRFVVQELEALTQRAELTPEEDKMVRESLGHIGQVLAARSDAKIAQELGEGRRLAALQYLQYVRRKYNGSAEEFNKRASLWEKGRVIWALHVLTQENQ